MPDRSLYLTKLRQNGISQRERIISLTKRDIAQSIVHSPSYKQVVVNENKAQYLEIAATQTDNKKRFTTMPDEIINLGDLISWNDMHWLVVAVDFDDEIVRRGEIEQCNMIVRMQNPDSLEIIERWCIASKPYTSNIDEGNVLALSNREYKIQLPYDNETSLIDVDRRFLLEKIGNEPKAYKVTSVDTLTNRYQDIDNNSGFLIWNLSQDKFNPETDNPELMIADYINAATLPSPPVSGVASITFKGKPTIRLGGSSKLFHVVFEDSFGNIMPIINPIWNVDIPVGFVDKITTDINSDAIKLKALDFAELEGVRFILKVSSPDGVYNASLEVEVVA